MRILAALSLLVALSCGGDSPSEPTDRGPLAPDDVTALSLAVVSGDAQADTIDALLPEPITVRVTDQPSGNPVQGQVVNFVVVEEGCGRAFAGSAATDSLGRAADRWELGTSAGDCTMEVRSVTPAGEVQVFATVTATVAPGAVHELHARIPSNPLHPMSHTDHFFVGDTLDVADWVDEARDRAGHRLSAEERGPPRFDRQLTIQRSGTRIWSMSEGATRFALQLGDVTSKELTVHWVQDLRSHEWSATGTCTGKVSGPDVVPDSIAFDFRTDSVHYRSYVDEGVDSAGNHHGTIYSERFHLVGDLIEYFPDSVSTTRMSETVQFKQKVGELWWNGVGATSTSDEPMPASYTGGDWCVEPFTRQRNAYQDGSLTFSRAP